jgi:hypothetical protein
MNIHINGLRASLQCFCRAEPFHYPADVRPEVLGRGDAQAGKLALARYLLDQHYFETGPPSDLHLPTCVRRSDWPSEVPFVVVADSDNVVRGTYVKPVTTSSSN